MELVKKEKIKEISPVSLPCFDFKNEQGKIEKKTVIIAPIAINYNKNGIIISWACSRAPYCYDEECRYSKHQKGSKKQEPEKYEEYWADY